MKERNGHDWVSAEHTQWEVRDLTPVTVWGLWEFRWTTNSDERPGRVSLEEMLGSILDHDELERPVLGI